MDVPKTNWETAGLNEACEAEDLYDNPGQAFPCLPNQMLERLAAYGRRETFDVGDFLFEVGQRDVDLFVILEGDVDILERNRLGTDSLMVSHHAGEFTGELDQLSGRAVLVCAKAATPTTVLRIDRSSFALLARAEPDISELIVRSLILRRAGMIAHTQGGTLILGSNLSGDTLRIQSFLVRNGYPYKLVDTDTDYDPAELLKTSPGKQENMPLVVLDGKKTLSCPSNRELADALGISEDLDESSIFDVVVVGAGPAGLAAAVYSASEGLSTLVVEVFGPGGQAGSSSRIENYLGFPMGISGQGLASRAQVQAQRFGARIVVARAVTKLDCSCWPFRVHLDDGATVSTRSVVIATGARYRRLELPRLATFEGQGVHYAATALEAKLCKGSEVVVVGGGNSAGQATLFLAQRSRHVHIVIRGVSLSRSMSDYLIQRIVGSPSITLHTQCEITSLRGDKSLEAVLWRSRAGDELELKTQNLFSMIGAVPNTDWLNNCVELDERGFVETGGRSQDGYPRSQFASSVDGVFAVGDVRARSIKRVAAGVGEGSVVVHAIHEWLSSR